MDFQLESTGSEASARRHHEHRGGKGYPWERKKLTLYQGALYHCHTLADKLEEVLQFVVPTAHWVAAMNGCHWDAGRQGQQQILYLLQDCFWPPSMATCRCRKWLATANNASNMKALKPKHQCSPSLPLLLWSCYTWISQALRWLWS